MMHPRGLYRRILRRLQQDWIRFRAPRHVRFTGRSYIEPSVRFLGHHGEIVIGGGSDLLRNCELLAPVSIGDFTFINRDVYIRSETTIGNHVAIGPFCRLITDSHEIGPHQRRAGADVIRPIVIRDGAWIGAASTILGGVTIGEGAIVAAGSVVVEDVPPDMMVAGVPARPVRSLAV